MTLFILPSPHASALAPLPARLSPDLAPEARAVLDWAAHVAAGRIGGGGAAPPAGGGERGFAALEAILGRAPRTGRTGA